MADEIQAPGCPTGLTLSAKLYAGGALVQSVALTESPAGSTNYANTGSLTLASGSYAVLVKDAGGNVYATGELTWNGTIGSAGANVVRLNGVDAAAGSLPAGTTAVSVVGQSITQSGS